MNARVLAGTALILLGAFILVRGLTYSQKKDVVDIGVIKVSTDERKSVPTWVGGILAIAGVVVIFAGAGKKN